MLDTNFMHAVVLVVQHTASGAHGFVLNQRLGPSTADLLGEGSALARAALPVRAGGPVGLDSLQFLHRIPDVIPRGMSLGGGLFLGGDLDGLPEDLDGERLGEGIRVFVGYSGWGPGQLEGELAAGGWLTVHTQSAIVFEAEDREPTWRRVLRSLGGAGPELSQQPPDPSWN